MSDNGENPTRYVDEDGSIYSAEIVPPGDDALGAQYHVDLVRLSTDAQGLDHEQRLTVGGYPSWMEAEEHLVQVETALERDGLAGWGDDAERLRDQPDEGAVTYLVVAYPPDGDPTAAYLLAIGANGVASASLKTGEREPVEAAVERVDVAFALEGTDAGLAAAQVEAERSGSRTVGTPLFAPEDRPLRHVDGGGTAHWFDVAATDNPGAHELRYFRELDMPDGATRRDSYPVMPLPDDDPGSAWPLPGLEMYLAKGDVFMAQQFAHDVADAYDRDFPDPLDIPALYPRPEYYFGYGVGPSTQPSLEAVKTWMDGSERRFDTLTVGEYPTYEDAGEDERDLEQVLKEKGLESAMNRAERMAVANGYLDPQRTDERIFFEDDAPEDPFITERERELAGPSYHVGAIAANGEAFLDVMKTWGADDYERLVIPQPDWEAARGQAEATSTLLERGDVTGAMRLVEEEGVAAGVIDPDRTDPRLFTQGPPDAFVTLREDEINDSLARHGVTWRETQAWAAEAASLEPEESPHWHLQTLPVNDPDGASLGHALHIAVYDGLPYGAERTDIPADEPVRLLEMAHFETTGAADKFAEEFKGYLLPGLLEGPELAEEVARLENLPVAWKPLTGEDRAAFQRGDLTLTHDRADWHPYNPNAEYEARLEAEGLYTDPLHQAAAHDEPETPPVAPDFDL